MESWKSVDTKKMMTFKRIFKFRNSSIESKSKIYSKKYIKSKLFQSQEILWLTLVFHKTKPISENRVINREFFYSAGKYKIILNSKFFFWT